MSTYTIAISLNFNIYNLHHISYFDCWHNEAALQRHSAGHELAGIISRDLRDRVIFEGVKPLILTYLRDGLAAQRAV